MTKQTYARIEEFMLDAMQDSAHDKQHVYRVLNTALRIASQEKDVDMDVLISACLLHDIGRQEQLENPALCHAQVGGQKACDFLVALGYMQETAERVKSCIETHRFRGNNPAQSMEAKILFDADKLDVCGALGVARTLFYQGRTGTPLYWLSSQGDVVTKHSQHGSSFFQEYQFKLKNLYDAFYTATAKGMARGREKAAQQFYESLKSEVQESHANQAQHIYDALE